MPCVPGPRRSAIRRFGPIVILVAGLGFGYAMGWHDYLSLNALAESRDVLKSFVAKNLLLAGFMFCLAYVLAVAFSFPVASILTIFGGFLFGWVTSSLLVAVGATTGATVLFLAARSACADFLNHKMGGFAGRLAAGFEQNAFSYLIILRLAPFVPFCAVNIAPAFFNVSTRTFVVATFIGILPGVIAYSYLGQGVDSIIVAAAAAGREVTIKDLVTLEIKIALLALTGVALLATLVKKFHLDRQPGRASSQARLDDQDSSHS